MDPEIIDNLTKLVTFGTAVVGFLVALVKASWAGGSNGSLLDKVKRSNLADDDKQAVRNGLNVSRTPWMLLALLSCVVGGLGVWNYFAGYNKQSFSKSLAKHDQRLFYYSKSGLHDVARGFPDKASLDNDSALDVVLKLHFRR